MLGQVEQDQAREAIRALVRRQGARLKGVTANGMVAALVAAALAPIATGPEALVALLGATGGGYITDFLKGVIGRLRGNDGAPVSEHEVQQELERALLACLEAQDEHTAGLRADAAALLESVRGVQTALEAASEDVQVVLTEAFTELGGEFRWMLDESLRTLTVIQRTQSYHTRAIRELLVTINRLVQPDAAPVEAAKGDDGEVCPYPGLAAFQAEDAQWFFGRQRLVCDLVVRLSEAPFLAVIGPSGSGKSSVLRAGLLPALWGGALPCAQVWTTIVVTPGAHPLEELAVRLGVTCGVAAESLLGDWQARPVWLRLAVRQALADAPEGARLLLLVDQFEEVFTLCADESERRGFVQALARLAGDADGQAIVVLGVRADFYARCAQHPELIDVLQDRQVLVGAMTLAETREAITGPAARAGLGLEAGLVETMLADLGEEPGSLPLLAHALFTTWQRREGDTLTLAGYRDAGGIRQAIGRTADTVFAGLGPAQQLIAQDVFLRLTALGEGTEDTRRRASLAELMDGRDPDAVQVTLDRLARARLVTLDGDSAQVAHEALIREWARLRGWLTEDREGLRIHRRLTDAAGEWEALGRDSGALYRGARLAGAREWAEGREQRLNDSERAFLAASRDRERDELETAQRRNRRLRALAGALALLLVVIVGFGVAQAQRQRALATARQLAVRASANPGQTVGLLVSLESLRAAPTDEGRASLLQGLLAPPRVRMTLTGHTELVWEVAFSPDGRRIASAAGDGTIRRWDAASGAPVGQPLTGHAGLVLALAFSPDGTRIASAGQDMTVRLWDAITGEPVGEPLTGHTGWVYGVAFSPDGTMLASAGADLTVRLWDAATGEPRSQLSADDTIGFWRVAFSPDGTTIAAAALDAVWLWDAVSGQPIGEPLTAHTGAAVHGVAFSPDGTMLAAAGADRTVRLWDVGTGEPIGRALTGHTDTVNGVAFSPDGTTLASASFDGTVRLWDMPLGDPISQPLDNHILAAAGVAFSPDGATLASGSGPKVVLWDVPAGAPLGQLLTGHTDQIFHVTFTLDGTTLVSYGEKTARRWDAATGAPIGQPLTGHTDRISRWQRSRDGTKIAAGGADGTVRLWDVATGEPIGQPLTGHTGEVDGVAFSPDGAMLASAGSDRTVRLWDVATGAPVGQPLTGHTDRIWDVGFIGDGSTLVSAGGDGTLRLWDVAKLEPIGQPLTGHTAEFVGLFFSPDGTTFASASVDDGTMWLWDTAPDEPVRRQLAGRTGGVSKVLFSPDGRMLASGGTDGTVRLWDVRTGEPIGQPLVGHTARVFGLAFSPDGTKIASTSADETVRVWDVATGAPFGRPFAGHTGWVHSVDFSPDGTKIATAGLDRTVRLWPITVDAWIEHACTLAGRNLTRDEWDRFVGAGRPYVRPCADFPAGAGAPTDAPAATYRID